MADSISPQAANPPAAQSAGSDSDPNSFNFEQFIEQMMDPDGVVVSVGVRSDGGTILGIPFEGGIVGVQAGYNQQDGFSAETNGKVTPKTDEAEFTLGGKDVGITLGGRFGVPGIDGINTPTLGGDAKVKIGGMEFEVREGFDVNTGSKFRTYQMSLPDHLAKQMPEKIEKALDKLPDRARDFLTKAGRGPLGLVTDLDAKVRITEEFRQDGQVVTYSGLQLEASPSETLSIDGVLDFDKFKVVAQVDGVFMDDEFALTGFAEDGIPTKNSSPLDTYGVMNPQTNPGYVGTVELSPRQSVMVTADGRTVAGMETVRPETAMALRGIVREATAADYDAKAVNTDSDALRMENKAIAGAIRDGASIRDALNLGVEVRSAQTFHGDNRNADALIADSQDNGAIDGSNLPEVTIGNKPDDPTYAVSAGGGVMHGRTTMTPGELAARANAYAADGGEVAVDTVAKAQADAMAQSLRDGLSVKDQLAVEDRSPAALDAPAALAPGDLAASVRADLEAMVDDENAAALAGQERKALEGIIAEIRDIEAAARFEGAKGLADNEYDVAMQMQERQALDNMINEAKKLDVLADVPIPAFKPDLPRAEPSDGPDMRGGDVAYGRGTVENGPAGKNASYDNFGDWANDMSDMFSGNGPKEGVATPNKAEVEQQEAEKKEAEAEKKAEAEKEEAEKKEKAEKHEGGENRGQQGPTENEQRDFGGSASDYSGSSGLL